MNHIALPLPKAHIKPIEARQAERIINNILDACMDISQLSEEAYHWLRLRAGFIAHHTREGFIADFQHSLHLYENILAYEYANVYCNQFPNDPDYLYCKQQCEMYATIIDRIKQSPDAYQPVAQTQAHFQQEVTQTATLP